MRLEGPLGILSRFREEFSFVGGNYLILLLSWAIMGLVGGIPYTYWGLYVIELGGSAFIIGLIDAVFQLSNAAVQIPGGYLADRYGRRWLIVYMTLGLALSNLFYVLAPSWHLILVGALIEGLCRIYIPALTAITADSIPSGRRGVAFSLNILVGGIASIPGPMIAGLLYVRFGLAASMRLVFLLVTMFFIVAAALRFRLKETVESLSRVDLGEVLRAYPQAIRECIGVWMEVPRSLLYLLVSDVSVGFSFSMVFPYLVVYAVEELGVPKFQWSIIMTIYTASQVVFALPIGKLVDKLGRRRPMMIANALLPLFSLLFIYGDFTRLIAAYLIMGLMMALFQSSYSSLRADLTPKEQRGRVMGSMNFLSAIVWAAGSLFGGYVYQNISSRLVFAIPIALTIPQILIILSLIKEPERREL